MKQWRGRLRPGEEAKLPKWMAAIDHVNAGKALGLGFLLSELCHAWQASYRAMLMSDDPAKRARIAAARGRYLDALAESNQDGFTRWMESGTAAAGDPSVHLGHGAAHPPEQE